MNAGHATLLLAALLACPLCPVWANDRPYANTWTAVGDEDDDGLWALETWAQTLGPRRGLTLAPEYAFNPRTTLQFEFTLARDHGEAARELEVEFKQLFNSYARDGWGVGVVASLGLGTSLGREAGQGGRSFKAQDVALRLPVSLRLSEEGAVLHLNVGVEKPRGQARALFRSVATEVPLFRRTTAFAELSRSGDATLAQLGVRHWIKRERFAVDMGVLRAHEGGARQRGWSLGLSWFDL